MQRLEVSDGSLGFKGLNDISFDHKLFPHSSITSRSDTVSITKSVLLFQQPFRLQLVHLTPVCYTVV